MDPRITDLKSTTFSGRRLTRRQIADIQKTVALFPNHSRNELAKTFCEHLNWVSAKGDYKVGACMKLLEALERHGILTLPPKREAQVRDMTSGPVWTSASDRRPALCADLSDLRPLRLEPVTDTDGRQLWNAFVDRHHYLGYRRPFGAHIRYFVADREGRKLGCLLFEAATKTLPCRDNWIGWSDRARGRSRHLMVVNSRFLVFPWVRSKNLASSALALATRRLADDWQRLHGYRPVLCETFVDETRFRASCYRAANWERIGSTGGQSVKHPCLKSSPNRADSQLTGVCVQQVLHKYSTAYPHDGIADLGAFWAHLRPSRSSTFAKIMSFRMMATMATLCRLPLAINRSYSAAMSWFHR